MVGVKDKDIEVGLGQYIAQMIATKILNEREGYAVEHVYGCVTTGEDWQFLKIEESLVLLDSKRYYLQNLNEILGVFNKIVQ